MPNKPRASNPHRSVRVENELWDKAGEIAEEQGTTRSAVIQEALRAYVKAHVDPLYRYGEARDLLARAMVGRVG